MLKNSENVMREGFPSFLPNWQKVEKRGDFMNNEFKNKSKELVKALQIIRKYGRSEITNDTYKRFFCTSPESKNMMEHNLAFAELMSRLAPATEKDEWYIAGLFNDISERNYPHTDVKSLMEKARLSPGLIYAVSSFRTMNNPKSWNPLITALNFADTHIDGAEYVTTAECCEKKETHKRCNECMYARHIFSQSGFEEEAEEIIKILQTKAELKKIIILVTNRKEGTHGIHKQGGMEKRGKKANAFAPG